jgi:uncharacterized membrane-anchored protein YhcB (DUF1043 family)
LLISTLNPKTQDPKTLIPKTLLQLIVVSQVFIATSSTAWAATSSIQLAHDGAHNVLQLLGKSKQQQQQQAHDVSEKLGSSIQLAHDGARRMLQLLQQICKTATALLLSSSSRDRGIRQPCSQSTKQQKQRCHIQNTTVILLRDHPSTQHTF